MLFVFGFLCYIALMVSLVRHDTLMHYSAAKEADSHRRIPFFPVTFPGMLRVFRECGVDGHRLWMDILIQYVNL